MCKALKDTKQVDLEAEEDVCVSCEMLELEGYCSECVKRSIIIPRMPREA